MVWCGVVKSDYSVSSLSLSEIKSKEIVRVERKIELDNSQDFLNIIILICV